MPECRLAVLGMCCADMQSGAEGVGKSSLCTRFVHPDVDDWKELGKDHSHFLSQADFQEPEINGDQFLYYGVGRRDHYSMQSGGLTGKGQAGLTGKGQAGLSMHIIEHTAFVDDSTGRQYPANGPYSCRATSVSVSSRNAGKLPYSCRSHLGESTSDSGGQDSRRRSAFPKDFAKSQIKDPGVHGYIFVMDPTANEQCRQKQWALWEECWSKVPASRKKESCCAIVLAKCDQVQEAEASLQKTFRVVEHFTCGSGTKTDFKDEIDKNAVRCGKISVPVFFTSAEGHVGVDLPFVYLSHKVLGLPGRPIGPVSWKVAVKMKQKQEEMSLAAATAFLKEYVTKHTQTLSELSSLYNNTVMDMFRSIHGDAECKVAFKSRLMALMVVASRCDVTAHHGNGNTAPAVKAAQYSTFNEAMKQRLLAMIRDHPDLCELITSSSEDEPDFSTEVSGLQVKQLRRSVVRKSFMRRGGSHFINVASNEPILFQTTEEGGMCDEDADAFAGIDEWFADVNSEVTGKRMSYDDWNQGVAEADHNLQLALDVLLPDQPLSPDILPIPHCTFDRDRPPMPIPGSSQIPEVPLTPTPISANVRLISPVGTFDSLSYLMRSSFLAVKADDPVKIEQGHKVWLPESDHRSISVEHKDKESVECRTKPPESFLGIYPMSGTAPAVPAKPAGLYVDPYAKVPINTQATEEEHAHMQASATAEDPAFDKQCSDLSSEDNTFDPSPYAIGFREDDIAAHHTRSLSSDVKSEHEVKEGDEELDVDDVYLYLRARGLASSHPADPDANDPAYAIGKGEAEACSSGYATLARAILDTYQPRLPVVGDSVGYVVPCTKSQDSVVTDTTGYLVPRTASEDAAVGDSVGCPVSCTTSEDTAVNEPSPPPVPPRLRGRKVPAVQQTPAAKSEVTGLSTLRQSTYANRLPVPVYDTVRRPRRSRSPSPNPHPPAQPALLSLSP